MSRPVLHLSLVLGRAVAPVHTCSFLATGVAASLLLVTGCASFHPRPLEEVGFEKRAQTKTDGDVHVSVTALTKEEARGALGVDVADAGIQPVWVKVENREAIGFVIPPIVIDREYFSPMEAAWQAHGWLSGGTNARIDEHFRSLHLPMRVGPGETVSGFVFTNLDKGVKYVNVELIGASGDAGAPLQLSGHRSGPECRLTSRVDADKGLYARGNPGPG